MQSNNKKKICIVVSSLGRGGAQKASATLSKMLHGLGYNVHIVSVLNQVEYDYKGTLFNLGALKDEKDTFLGRIDRLRKFKQYLKMHQFDCVIDNRARVSAYRAFLVSKFVYRNVPVVYVIHNYKTSHAFSKYNSLSKWLYKNENMIAVSNEARDKFKQKFNLKNITTIYNAFDGGSTNNTNESIIPQALGLDKYIIFFGRIKDKHKNLRLLLDAYKVSKLSQLDYKLLILGDGENVDEIKDYAIQLNLKTNVVFKSYVVNPANLVRNARFTVLTSRYEGFPMVLIESLSLKTPVIAVDCKSGPKEVIINEVNGLLVENYKVNAFAEAMNRFIENETVYETCKQNAKQSITRFSMDSIAKDWKQYIEQF
jgi:glycosyltransferase involved in cell wall biosynthesis